MSSTVPAETDLEEPLEIQFVHAGGQTHTRLPVSFGAASRQPSSSVTCR
jgi:Fe-S cluster assembly protein SufD